MRGGKLPSGRPKPRDSGAQGGEGALPSKARVCACERAALGGDEAEGPRGVWVVEGVARQDDAASEEARRGQEVEARAAQEDPA